MTKEDEQKFRDHIRVHHKMEDAKDGDAWFEHAVAQKIQTYEWSLAVEPSLTVEQYLSMTQEPWFENRRKGKRSKRHCHS